MTDERCLAYIADPFGTGVAYIGIEAGSAISLVDPSELSETHDHLITYDVPTLIDEYRRRQLAPPRDMIDLAEVIRLCTGVARSDGGERRWSFWRAIRGHFESHESWKLAVEIHRAQKPPPENAAATALLRSTIAAIRSLWTHLKASPAFQGESKRFYEIERPVANVFHYRQYVGIGVDARLAQSYLREVADQKYQAYLRVAEQIGQSPTGLNYWNVSRCLSRTDAAHLVTDADGHVLRDRLKIAASSSKFAEAFTTFMDSSVDVETLTRLCDSDGRVYPVVHNVGTITSRVLVSDPPLQQMRRRYRGVITADDGHSLLYFDYAQFEPGILASLSGDKEMKALYNARDLYTALGIELFGTKEKRDLCKRICLAFIYGMSPSGIARLISGQNARDDDRILVEESVRQFFSRFPAMMAFRDETAKKLQCDGYVSTSMGNRRIRVVQGKLNPREHRWAINQLIQGTASLIFKHAIKELAKEFGASAIILPMHDAVLMQYPRREDVSNISTSVEQIMISSFTRFAPGVQPRITVGAFAS